MQAVDVVVEVAVSSSVRARQLEALFDVPRAERSTMRWRGGVDIDERPWNVGLVVGPSGSGKSVVSASLFGRQKDFTWSGASVVDDFDSSLSMEEISKACSAVGFNTIPSWLRPYKVLSTGEKFRVELARLLLCQDDILIMDEFTSVVDRQVAKIGSHAVQKYIRKQNRKFVAVSCHDDIVDWLQPDWILEPATMTLTWRSLRRRPGIDVTIRKVHWGAWKLFSRYHYMTAQLNKNAQCFALLVGDKMVSFDAVIHMPHPINKRIKALHRGVTLPDWQGLGLTFVLSETLGAAYKALGYELRSYPAHPGFVRARDRSPNWVLKKPPGFRRSNRHQGRGGRSTLKDGSHYGMRQGAVFKYCGPGMLVEDAKALLYGDLDG